VGESPETDVLAETHDRGNRRTRALGEVGDRHVDDGQRVVEDDLTQAVATGGERLQLRPELGGDRGRAGWAVAAGGHAHTSRPDILSAGGARSERIFFPFVTRYPAE